MSTLDNRIQDFLAQKKIAVVGISDRRDTGCNTAYQRFKANGYKVYGINPRIKVYEGDPVYADLKSLPEAPDAVFILAKPSVTEEIVDQAIEVGAKHIWMHCMMGVRPGLAKNMTSVSQAAVDKAIENGISVIPGTCPNQYLEADGAHRFMNRFFKLLGFLRLAPQHQ